MTKAVFIILVMISCFSVSVSIADNYSELDTKIEEIFSGKNISEELKKQFKLQLLSIMATKNLFTYKEIKDTCKEDLDKFCSAKDSVTKQLDCIKESRNQVSQICEGSLRNTFGGKPFSEDRMHAGVMLPQGSHFFYDSRGNILGAIVSKNFKYQGIEYEKGQVRFNETGLSVAQLTKDQKINGILYKAPGTGPFFDTYGNVSSATLAEDTEISGVFYKSGTQIRFSSIGKVQHGVLAKDVSIAGKGYKAETRIFFKANGEIFTRH